MHNNNNNENNNNNVIFVSAFISFLSQFFSFDTIILSQILLTLCLHDSKTKFVMERLQSVVKRALIWNQYAWEAISPIRSNMSAEIRFSSDNIQFIRDTVSQGFHKWERNSMKWNHWILSLWVWIETRLLRRREISPSAAILALAFSL